MRLELDASTRIVDDGAVVIGGSPLSLFRLGVAGARIANALADGRELPAGHGPLTQRLLAAGAVHPRPDEGDGPDVGEVTAVIPVKDGDRSAIAALVESLRSDGVREVIVVDDASAVPLDPIEGATILRLRTNVGPGAARGRGVDLVATPFVAFVDADARPEAGWLMPLLGHLAEETVALVAPRVRGAGGSSWLARFETWRSPLDLGPQPARVRAGSRVSYVPAAALVVRLDAFRAIGGFDPALRFGEDVDLVWRLDQAGHRCRYEPDAVVRHDTRPTLRRWLRQRFDYGTSAAPLEQRHPGALAPIRVSGWSALAWGVAAAASVPLGVVIGAGTTAALAPKLRPMQHPWSEALRLGGLGNLYAGRILASAVTRSWWPVTLLLALVSRRARRVAVLCALGPALLDWNADRPGIDPGRAVVLRLFDDLAYGAGVWVGCWRHRSARALRPDLRNWPPRRPTTSTSQPPTGR